MMVNCLDVDKMQVNAVKKYTVYLEILETY